MNKTLRVILLAAVMLVLLGAAFGGGVAVGRFLPVPGTTVTTASPTLTGDTGDTGTPANLQESFAPFWEAWDIIHQEYYLQPLDDASLVDGAIHGLMDALPDENSSYLNADETTEFFTDLSGEYEGIGAYVDVDGEYLTIIRPMPDSPAEAAGLQPGDQIIAVDGEDIAGMDPNIVRKDKVMGPAGTTVVLTILRPGVEEPFDVTVTRAHIVVPSVEGRMLDSGIAYISISIFGDTTGDEFHSILADLLSQNPSGIILDLRNDPGGLTYTAVQVASEFIGEGVIYYEEFGDGTRYENRALSGGLATGDIPLVVVVNQYTISAAEIVAGAIQDTERGTLIGEVTFGKGTEQRLLPTTNEGTVRVTVAQWLTPNGRTINGIGLTPDQVVEMTDEDYQAERDPQLDAAVQFLQAP